MTWLVNDERCEALTRKLTFWLLKSRDYPFASWSTKKERIPFIFFSLQVSQSLKVFVVCINQSTNQSIFPAIYLAIYLFKALSKTMHQSLLCFGEKPPHNKKPPFGPWDRDKAFGFWAFIKQPCRVNGCKLGRWSRVFVHVRLWHANKYCSTVFAFNIAHVILTGQCILVTDLRYVHKEITRFQIQFCGNESFESHAGRGGATPSAGGCPTAAPTPQPEYPRQGSQVGAVTCARSGGARSPPNLKPFFPWLFVGRFGPTPA